MRLPLAFRTLATLVALATPALAAPAGGGDYKAALDIFYGGMADPLKYNESYAEVLTRGLDGRWAPLLSFPTGGGFADLLADTCERLPATIRTTPEHGFVLTRGNAKANAKYDVVFTPMSGSMFGQYTAPGPIFDYLGIEEGAGTPSLRNNILRANNGIAAINRLDENILVIQTNYGPPSLYGRCE